MKVHDYIEKGWCQGAYARDAHGDNVDEDSVHAVQWCLSGALRVALPHRVTRVKARTKIQKHIGGGLSLARWNDDPTRTRQEVVALLLVFDL